MVYQRGSGSGHYIQTKALRELIPETVRTASTFAIANPDEFMEKVRSASQIRQAEAAKETKRKLNKDRKRIAELDNIIKKLYESFAVGRISDERFDSLLAEYETEQKALVASVAEAEQRLSRFEEDTDRAEQFLSLAKKYTDFSELTTPMINEFIDKIIVHSPEKIEGDRVQEVEIYLKFIGHFDLPEPELTAEESKRQEQLRRHRIKSRERYQKIKAGEHAVGQPFKLTCKCCGEEFESKRSNTLFCGPNCRAKFYRQEAAESRSRECVCENCGSSFTTTRSDTKYCSDACRTAANRRMQKEYLCVRNGEERGFTAAEFKAAQADGWEKQYPYKVGRKKVYMPPSEAEKHGYERANKHPKSTKFGRQNPVAERWNSEEQLVEWRKAWADVTNRYLERYGHDERIDHRSHADRGLTEQPTIHEGVGCPCVGEEVRL